MYNILHIPSGHFLEIAYASEIWGYNKEPKMAVFKTKASAGHAIEDYRLGKRPIKNNRRGKGYTFMLEMDYKIIKGIRNIKEVVQLSLSFEFETKFNRIEIQTTWDSKSRERSLKRLGISIPSKTEFLIMETI